MGSDHYSDEAGKINRVLRQNRVKSFSSEASVKNVKKRINVVGAVLKKDGRILAARRGENMSLPGMWEFPGGKIEPGETAEDALSRELREELLIEAKVGKHVETTAHEYDFGIVVLSTFYCELIAGEPTLTEHAEIRWVLPAEMGDLDWAPADIPAVERIIQRG